VQTDVGNSGSPSATSLFPRTPATGERETLPIRICGAKIRPRNLNLLLEGRSVHTAALSGHRFPGYLTEPRLPLQGRQQGIAVGGRITDHTLTALTAVSDTIKIISINPPSVIKIYLYVYMPLHVSVDNNHH
jgi:hypothetical protein